MKKVWILEKWLSPEAMERSLNDMKEIADNIAMEAELNHSQRSNVIQEMYDSVHKLEMKHSENPDGYWCGWQGKIHYKSFCEYAKQSLRLAKPGDRFRVIEGMIKDTDETWAGYIPVKENPGVLKYLYATINQ